MLFPLVEAVVSARIEHMFDTTAIDRLGRTSLVEALLAYRSAWTPPSVLELYEPRRGVEVELRPHATGGQSVEREWRPFAALLDEGAAHLGSAAAAEREERRQAAVRARSLAAFAAQRPAAVLDRPAGEVGAAAVASREARPAALTEVSEWAVDEVMVALGLSSQAASALLAESVALVEQMPATLDALESGTLSYAHVRMLIEVLAPLSDEVRGEVEAKVLSRAAGRTVSQLRASARRAVQHADAGAAVRRLARAIRDRKVRVFPGEDGMASLVATLPLPLALACEKTLAGHAEECRTPEDERTKDQRMADCFVDSLLRPGATDMAPVRVDLTVVASVDTLRGSDEPGEIDGHPVPAVVVRELADVLGLLSGPDEADGLGRLLSRRPVSGTALARLPQIAVVDELSGQLLALTSTAEIRRIADTGTGGLGPPPDTPGYSPSAVLDRFVRMRDRRCRFPGCRAPAIRCDLDHNVPWPAGETSDGNVCCLCRHHHRLSHQAPGWRMRRFSDGGLEWTTPGGDRLTTYPPRYGSDDATTERAAAPPRTLRERVLGRPATPEEMTEDPTPF